MNHGGSAKGTSLHKNLKFTIIKQTLRSGAEGFRSLVKALDGENNQFRFTFQPKFDVNFYK